MGKCTIKGFRWIRTGYSLANILPQSICHPISNQHPISKQANVFLPDMCFSFGLGNLLPSLTTAFMADPLFNLSKFYLKFVSRFSILTQTATSLNHLEADVFTPFVQDNIDSHSDSSVNHNDFQELSWSLNQSTIFIWVVLKSEFRKVYFALALILFYLSL